MVKSYTVCIQCLLSPRLIVEDTLKNNIYAKNMVIKYRMFKISSEFGKKVAHPCILIQKSRIKVRILQQNFPGNSDICKPHFAKLCYMQRILSSIQSVISDKLFYLQKPVLIYKCKSWAQNWVVHHHIYMKMANLFKDRSHLNVIMSRVQQVMGSTKIAFIDMLISYKI